MQLMAEYDCVLTAGVFFAEASKVVNDQNSTLQLIDLKHCQEI